MKITFETEEDRPAPSGDAGRAEASGRGEGGSPARRADAAPARFDARAVLARWPHTVAGGIAGLVLAVLLLTLGFWRALIVAVFVGIGLYAGQVLDGDSTIERLVRKVLRRRD